MRKLLPAFLLAIFLILSFSAKPQTVSFGYQMGVRNFTMDNLKKINGYIQEELPFDSKVVSNFPPYMFFRPMIQYEFKGVSLGLMLSFQSTGSRLSAKDFSADYHFDFKIRSIQYGLILEKKFYSNEKIDLSFSGSLGPISTTLVVNESFIVNDTQITDELNTFFADNWFFECGAVFTYKVSRWIYLSPRVNYQFLLGSQYLATKKNDAFLQAAYSQKPVVPEWNGFLFGLSINLRVNH